MQMERGKYKLPHVTRVCTVIPGNVCRRCQHHKRKPHDDLYEYVFKILLSILLGVTPRSRMLSKDFKRAKRDHILSSRRRSLAAV